MFLGLFADCQMGSAAISKVPQVLSPEMDSSLRAVPPKPYTGKPVNCGNWYPC